MIGFVVDTTPADAFLATVFADQLPFATSLALNQTAKQVQDAERKHLAAAFTIRKPWVTQGVTIPRFSDKTDAALKVDVTIDPQRGFLAKFELGGEKLGTEAQPIAVPSAAIRPSFGDLPPLALYPKNLGLQVRRGVTGLIAPHGKVSRRGVLQVQGKSRTFVLTTEMFGVADPGVYQRTGPGKQDIRLLWSYKSQIPIPARLDFTAVAGAVVAAHWAENFTAAFRRAIQTATH